MNKWPASLPSKMQVPLLVCLLPLFMMASATSGGNTSIIQHEGFQTRQIPTFTTDYKLPYTYQIMFQYLRTARYEVSYVIQGYTPHNSQKFTVELCVTQDCYLDKALHLSMRFNKHYVVRTGKKDGVWEKEITRGDMPFTRGSNFALEIRSNKGGKYRIYVNNLFFTDFNYIVPMEGVRYIMVFGDVKIRKISEQMVPPQTQSSGHVSHLFQAPTPGDWFHYELTLPSNWDQYQLYLACTNTTEINQFQYHMMLTHRKIETPYLSSIINGVTGSRVNVNYTVTPNRAFSVDFEIRATTVQVYVNNQTVGHYNVAIHMLTDTLLNGRVTYFKLEYYRVRT